MRNPVIGKVSSEFNINRIHPVTGKKTSHVGIDIAAVKGTKIRAAFSGRVIGIKTNSYHGDKNGYKGYKTGNYIIIQNDDGACQYYGHIDESFVKLNQYVNESNVIATVGDSGIVTRSHLHFETWSSGNWLTYFNPRILFNRYSLTPGIDNPQKVFYTVKKGDTLSSIGKRFDVSISRLKTRNGIVDPNVIYVGQSLWVTNE